MNTIKNIICCYLGKFEPILDFRVNKIELKKDNLKIIFLQYDGKLGDTINWSKLVIPLIKNIPNCKITVATTANLKDYWIQNPNISEVMVLPQRNSNFTRFFKIYRVFNNIKRKYDVSILFEPSITIDTLFGIRILHSKINIGFTKDHFSLFDISLFDYSFYWKKKSIEHRILGILDLFNIDTKIKLQPFIPISEKSILEFNNIRENIDGIHILFNTYGSAKNRIFFFDKVYEIISRLSLEVRTNVVIYLNLCSQYSLLELNKLEDLNNINIKIILLPNNMKLTTLFSLVSNMNLVITPDTGIVHVAAALGTPQVAIYLENYYNGIVWRPSSKCCKVLFSDNTKVNATVNDVSTDAIILECKAMLGY